MKGQEYGIEQFRVNGRTVLPGGERGDRPVFRWG